MNLAYTCTVQGIWSIEFVTKFTDRQWHKYNHDFRLTDKIFIFCFVSICYYWIKLWHRTPFRCLVHQTLVIKLADASSLSVISSASHRQLLKHSVSQNRSKISRQIDVSQYNIHSCTFFMWQWQTLTATNPMNSFQRNTTIPLQSWAIVIICCLSSSLSLTRVYCDKKVNLWKVAQCLKFVRGKFNDEIRRETFDCGTQTRMGLVSNLRRYMSETVRNTA